MWLAIILVAFGVLLVFVIVRFVWRLRNEEIDLEPGGSWGDQLTEPEEDEKPR
jgi:hypothetical protein